MEEEDVFTKNYDSPMHVYEDIEKLEENQPKDRRSKEYKKWDDKIDFLYHQYNLRAGFLAFRTRRAIKYEPIKQKRKRKPKQ